MKKNIILDIINKHNLNIYDYENYTSEIVKVIDYKQNSNQGKLVIVTSMNPTPVGEGKTTTSIGLIDGLNKIGIKAIGSLREPSIGPVFGMKGTGSGSNMAKLLPFDKINLHFTGDFHAITTANNLISAVIENEIYQNSSLDIDPNKIVWKRCMDMNDRSLRNIEYSISEKKSSLVSTSFNITAASDLMALFCLCKSKKDFINKINETIVAFNKDNQPITIKDLEISNAIADIMNDAFYPNLVRTLEDNLVFVHGGPFANIAHGCSSLISINAALDLGDVVITEAGFGSDLGLEKFMNITCQVGKLDPRLIVLVVSLKSILYNGNDFGQTNKEKIDAGFENILHHIEHAKQYGINLIVAINHRNEDLDEDMQYLNSLLQKHNIEYSWSDGWAQGSDGTIDLSNKVKNILENDNKDHYKSLYKVDDSLLDKISTISKNVYGADKVIFNDLAQQKINDYSKYRNYYVCISKNPYSLTCNPKILGKPKNFNTTIEDVEINHAAKLIIPITSVVYRMPGLPKVPAAKNFIIK